MIDVVNLNRRAWDLQSRNAKSPWVQPVSSKAIAAARRGECSVILTPNIPVPSDWLGHLLKGRRLLGLASGGGQQMPILAAAGADVTSFDNSPVQLAKDRYVARRDDLNIRFEQGDMADLSRFNDSSFDLIFHPISNVFVPRIRKVWRECARVLAPGGRLLAGFMNPDYFLFDHANLTADTPIEAKFPLPFSDLDYLDEVGIERRVSGGESIEFSHSLDDQIGGQLASGFTIAGFYEDRWDDEATPLNQFMPTSMATLAILTSSH